MKALRILYLGDLKPGCTSLHRCEALSRLGHEVVALNPKSCLRNDPFSYRLHFQTGYTLGARKARRWLRERLLGARKFDLAWVDNGECVSHGMLLDLARVCGRIVNYNCDDPTGRRDGLRWRTFRKSIPAYDLCAVVRQESADEYPAYGARAIIPVWRAADEVAHSPRTISPEIEATWASEVIFVGTWMPERGPFMARLLELGVPLSLRGIRWQKAPEWPRLKEAWRGGELVGDAYAYAIQCAKVNLGLLSKGNRDLHTTRTAEIPALGGLFCAERTTEHCAAYREGEEAIFWSDADECARLCLAILKDAAGRRRISDAGRRRWLGGPMRNEGVAKQILEQLLQTPSLSVA